MRKALIMMAAGTALFAAPAMAQVGLGGSVGGNVGLDPGNTVGNSVSDVTGRVGNTVDQVDRRTNDTVDATKMTLATREQVRAGVQVTDTAGNSVGTVQSVEGDNAVVVDGGKLYNVPLGSLYSKAKDGANMLVTKMPKAQIAAHAQGGAETR